MNKMKEIGMYLEAIAYCKAHKMESLAAYYDNEMKPALQGLMDEKAKARTYEEAGENAPREIILNSETRYAVLVPPCILSPGLQAERKPGGHWGYPFMELLMRYGVNPVLLPCPESSFGGFGSGLQRGKHGIDYYEGMEGYRDHCLCLAKESAEMILEMRAGGFRMICLLGIEHSPTCAVSYMYSHKGMLKRAGMFYEALLGELRTEGIDIPQIGINRTYPRKALYSLETAIENCLKYGTENEYLL